MVFCGLFPIDADQSVSSPYIEFSFFLSTHSFFIFKIEFFDRFEELREALEKLQLNDAALKVDFLTYLSMLLPFIRLPF
jgi:translation elongation factor EF-4